MKKPISKFWATISVIVVGLFAFYHILVNNKLEKDND